MLFQTERLNEIFSQAKARIVPLLQQITKAQAADPYVTPEPFQVSSKNSSICRHGS